MAQQLRVRYDPLGILELIVVGANTSKFSGVAEEREGLLIECDGRTNEVTAYSLPNFPDQHQRAIQQLRELAPIERYDVPQAHLSEVTLSEVVEWAQRTYLGDQQVQLVEEE